MLPPIRPADLSTGLEKNPTMTARKAQNISPPPDLENELAAREKIMGFDPFDDEVDEEEGGEGEDGALDPEASGGPEIAKVVVLADGALQPLRAEVLALAHADGFRGHEAWDMSGGGAKSYRLRIERNPVFQERVARLTAEREKLETDGVVGEMLWAAKQNWRLARAGGVVMEIHRATVLLVDVTKLAAGIQSGGEAAPVPEGEAAVPRPVGRPAHQPKALRVDVAQMREKLVSRAAPVPAAPQ